jgi:hypothetical protein
VTRARSFAASNLCRDGICLTPDRVRCVGQTRTLLLQCLLAIYHHVHCDGPSPILSSVIPNNLSALDDHDHEFPDPLLQYIRRLAFAFLFSKSATYANIANVCLSRDSGSSVPINFAIQHVSPTCQCNHPTKLRIPFSSPTIEIFY